MIELAIARDPPKLSALAIEIISNNQAIAKRIANSEALHEVERHVLEESERDEWELARFVELCQFIISSTGEFPVTMTFIVTLLPFINHFCVARMFMSLCDNDERFVCAQKWFSEHWFIPAIVSELKACRGINTADNFEKVRNLFELIRVCASCPNLRNPVTSVSVLEILNLDWDEFDEQTQDILWSLRLILYRQETKQYFRGLYPVIMDTMCGPYDKLRSYRVSAIQLIKNMLEMDDEVRPFIISANILHSTVLRLVFQFPENTFLGRAVIRLCSVCFELVETREFFVAGVVQPLVCDWFKSDCGHLSPTGFEIIEMAYQFGRTNAKFMALLTNITDFGRFVETCLKDRMRIAKGEYGGRLPAGWANTKKRPLIVD